MGISQMVGAEDVDIFLVEDSKFFRTVIKKQLEEELGFRVTSLAPQTTRMLARSSISAETSSFWR